MKAIVRHQYGSPDILRLEEVEKPTPKDDEILIKLHATSLNRSDWETLIGKPLYARMGGLFKPSHAILGSDIAGTVERAGKNHTPFKPGDEVYGDILAVMGGFAEYVCARGKVMALKPAGMSFEDASTIPQAGVIAMQGIYDKVQPGQQVLINGAGGGTGVFAIQLAKMRGAEVTGVDNGGKLEFMRALGADHVIDYTREDFTRTGKQYDLILDLVAHRSAFAYARALKPGGSSYLVGGSVGTLLQALLFGPLLGRTTGKHVRLLIVQPNRKDLERITALIQEGKVVTKIDQRFPLAQVPEAMRYLGEGRAKGKVVVRV
jgi:NADPH:quinone reductase-like Zn-dependent oxidoreductase